MNRRFAVLAVALLGCGTALAQNAGPPRRTGPAAPVTRFLSFSEGTLPPDTSVTVEGVLKTVTVGDQVRSAEIDLCFQSSKFSLRLDRVAFPLQVGAGTLLTGTGPGLDGSSTSVRIRRVPESGGTFAIEGEVNRQDLRLTLAGSGIEPTDEDPTDPAPEDSPAPSLVWSPNEAEITVALSALPEALKVARSLDAVVRDTNILPDCRVLRAGKVVLTAIAPPDKVATVLAEFAKLRGVSKAARVPSFDYDYVVRFQPAKLKSPTELAALLARSAEASIPGLSTVSTRVEPRTGNVVAVFRRVPAHFAALGLEERVTVKALLAPDKEAGHSLAFLRELEGRLVDPNSPAVIMPPSSPTEAMEVASVGSDINTTAAMNAIADAMTRELAGERIVNEAWTAPTRR